MGERTVREVLKRRSDDTLRKLDAIRNKGKKRAPRRQGFKRLTMVLLVLATVAALLWCGWLWFKATTAFGLHQWDQPARVYARALELYPKRAITVDELTAELQRLGYTSKSIPAQPGQYHVEGNRIRFSTRPFTFWDGEQPSLDVTVIIENSMIARMTQASQSDVYLVRLDPPLIGNIFPASGEDRIVISLEDLPATMKEMLLAIEDRRFYDHWGVDPRSIARALSTNLEAGEVRQGASTITQQLVKNFYLTPERTLARKINEAIMAIAIDATYDKDRILQAYINEVYLGQDGQHAIHGFGLASYYYFQKPVQELNVAEMATLIGMVKGPSWYDPVAHADRVIERRNTVLEVAVEQQVIETSVAEQAKAQSLRVSPSGSVASSFYPAFMQLLREQLLRDYDESALTRAGLRIFSTLDPEVQAAAEKVLSSELTSIERNRGLPEGSMNGAVVVTSVEGAEVQAVVGGRNARFAGFNRAISAVRPIGSLIKPVVYLTALSHPDRFTLVSELDDSPLEVQLPDGTVWKPGNYNNEYHDETVVFRSLVNSYNTSTVRLGLQAGVAEVIRNLQLLGFGRTPSAYPSLLLGAVTLTPLEVTQVYNTMATGGFRTPVNSIREVIGPDGAPLQRYPLEVNESVDIKSVYLVNRALQWVMREGTASAYGNRVPVATAGKTGTTDDYRDSWFAGYSGDHVAVVWVGRDDNAATRLTGATGALPVWARLMQQIAQEPYRPVRPEGVEEVWIDVRSWQRASEGCETARQLPFVAGSAPDNEPRCGSSVVDKLKNVFQ